MLKFYFLLTQKVFKMVFKIEIFTKKQNFIIGKTAYIFPHTPDANHFSFETTSLESKKAYKIICFHLSYILMINKLKLIFIEKHSDFRCKKISVAVHLKFFFQITRFDFVRASCCCS